MFSHFSHLQAFILLNDIRSVYNVGSIFRTADAAGVNGIYLAGHSPTPLDRFGRKRNDVAKVALGAEEIIPWQYAEDPMVFIKAFRKDWGKRGAIVAVEQHKKSLDYKTVREKLEKKFGKASKDEQCAILFVMGNEVEGVDKKVLKEADIIAEMSQRGKKESLNVSVAAGIALFRILNI
ncbi:MAG: TrmH family RNA methyltransferase [Patescibacteria group bacterium]